MVTLTCRHEESPSAQLQRMRKAFQYFVTDMRKVVGEFEYVRVLEQCVDGYPHFHLLARCSYVPQPRLKALWVKHTGAEIVDVRKAHGRSVAYVAKYIGKAFGTNTMGLTVGQRIGASHKFYGQQATGGDDYIAFDHHRMHPHHFVPENYGETLALQRIRWGLYHVVEREPGDDLPEELLPRCGNLSPTFDPPCSNDDEWLPENDEC